MKHSKTILFSVVLLLSFVFVGTINAQINFPLQVRVEWTPNAASDNVINYGVKVDALPVAVVPPTACVGTGGAAVCGYNFTIAAEGPHTVVVSATNDWATNSAGAVTFTARAPAIVNVRRVIVVPVTPTPTPNPVTPPTE